jgi:acetyl/propionyl-CoA carboxylase alpha subunit
MFKKLLIANRGEIAVRIIQTCREMGIETVALYEESDESSLHVRLADECVLLDAPNGFLDQAAILKVAREHGVEAIHPGYGFLAENLDFIHACEDAGIVFVGPPSSVVERVSSKLAALERVRAAGLPTVETSWKSYNADDIGALRQEADRIGYPLVIKSTSGGRGPGERMVHTPEELETALRGARTEAQLVYGLGRVYLEREIVSAHQVGVQVLADQDGNIVHLQEREGSLLHNGQKVIEESPAPCLMPDQRLQIWDAALEIARLFEYENLGTVEFLADQTGRFYFTEVKPRLQVEHPLTEMRARLDLVREQICIAAGEPLAYAQDDLHIDGYAMMCRVNAEDPLNGDLPSPGPVRVRLPYGAEVRVDTYIADHGFIPPEYNPLVAKVTTWAADRDVCLRKMRRALQDLWLPGGRTNLPLLQRLLTSARVSDGGYCTDFAPEDSAEHPEGYFRDLVAGAAVMYVKRHQAVEAVTPARLSSGWHRDSRRLPE